MPSFLPQRRTDQFHRVPATGAPRFRIYDREDNVAQRCPPHRLHISLRGRHRTFRRTAIRTNLKARIDPGGRTRTASSRRYSVIQQRKQCMRSSQEPTSCCHSQ